MFRPRGGLSRALGFFVVLTVGALISSSCAADPTLEVFDAPPEYVEDPALVDATPDELIGEGASTRPPLVDATPEPVELDPAECVAGEWPKSTVARPYMLRALRPQPSGSLEELPPASVRVEDAPELGVYIWASTGGFRIRLISLADPTEVTVVLEGDSGAPPAQAIGVDADSNTIVIPTSPSTVTFDTIAAELSSGVDFSGCKLGEVSITVLIEGQPLDPSAIFIGPEGRAEQNPVTISRG